MKLRTLLLTILVAGIASLASATDTPTGTAPTPAFPTIEFSPCAQNGHQLTVFSEGTAWNRGMKAAWLTAYNPTDAEQDVWVRIFVDGRAVPVVKHVKLGAHTRHAWHVNDELLFLESSSLGIDTPSRKKDFNFASEVLFQKVGVANLAVWELGSVGFPAYLRAAYVKGTDLCVTDDVEP